MRACYFRFTETPFQFFINFLQWACVFCMWTFATLIAGVVQESRHGDLDPQYIVIIAL